MDNVYGQVAVFYTNHQEADDILSKDIIERYLRKFAWRGSSDQEMCAIWSAIESLLLYIENMKLYSLDSLNVYDYQEILYRRQDTQTGFKLSETQVYGFFQILESFYLYLKKLDYDDYLPVLKEARESFSKDGTFFLPERQDQDEFYNNLSHLDEISLEEADKLNELLEQLLNKVGEYYRRPSFVLDLTRAVSIYAGPFMEVSKDNEEDFWFSFWDYFFFDYHLIETDLTPLCYYYEHEKERLEPSERYIIKDLLKARFMVFSINGIVDDFLECTDLFTGEQLNLPLPDIHFMDYKKVILYGHLHLSGVMMLNYITSVSASEKLRQRMKEEILRQYELYKIQEPKATIGMFFQRHAAAVRHTINILANFAQLKVVSTTSAVAPDSNAGVRDGIETVKGMLIGKAKKSGFSVYAIKLLLRLYEDFFVSQSACADFEKKALVAALLLIFSEINGFDFVKRDFI